MDAAFTSIAFAEPGRAETNLALIEQRLPASLWAALPTLLNDTDGVPDPDGSLNFLERYLRLADARILNHLERHHVALHYLLVIFSFSRFLSESLVQQPELILWLHRPGPRDSLGRLKSREDLEEDLARFETSGLGGLPQGSLTSTGQPPGVVLTRFKRREYLRILLRDALGMATLAETTLELSQLADVLLERALRICEQKLENAYGTPQCIDAEGRRHAVRMTIFSLGKLGGQELNYSSDVDLMFLYAHDGETAGGSAGTTANAEYFVRLAQAVLKLITEITPEGAVYRVDLRLRPQGTEGDLAVSLPAALAYYRGRAREWELQMLIKARCSAGDAETARRFLREVQPLIYRRPDEGITAENFAAVEAVLNARQEITRALRQRAERGAVLAPPAGGDDSAPAAAEWNVKLSPGGIRDIEFLVQCLARVHGGADPWLAAPATASTLVALQRLHDKGYLSGRDFFRLGTAYQFLRKVEHRLQLRDGLQRHTLPEAPDALERLARRCSVEASAKDGRTSREQLLYRVARHFAEVREIYDRLLVRERGGTGTARDAETPPEIDLEEGPLLRRLRQEFPEVARAVRSLEAGANPYVRRGLNRFLSSAVLDPGVMAQIEAHPHWLAKAAEIFSTSDLAVELLARNPEELPLVADPALAGSRGVWAAQPEAVSACKPFDEAIAALRVAYRRGLLGTIVHALLGAAKPFESFGAITQLAVEALEGALSLAAQEILPGTNLAAAPFAVIALGRLGTSEMDIGSDADLIFITDEGLAAEERDRWRRLAERFVHVVSSHTREGLLFPVDTRLRPRGGEGEIVQSIAYLRDYFHTEAQAWEAATYRKARPVAGNMGLGARTVSDVLAIVAERWGRDPLATRELAAELARTRERLEREGTGARAKGEFKKLSGGYYDVEYILAYLNFARRGLASATAPEATIAGPGHVLREIAVLESAGVLDATRAQTLRSAALLYRSIDHAIRLITGRTANHLPEPGVAARIARLLKLWNIPIEEDLHATLSATRAHVRTLYEQIVRASTP